MSPEASPLRNLVFFSNSVPKSGSTYLHAMQERFLLDFTGRKRQNMSDFADCNADMTGAYAGNPHAPEFLERIRAGELGNGPYIFKVHTNFDGALKEAILESAHVFASLSIRDPLEIVFSARDNFRKTGEFQEFADLNGGADVANTWFRRIYESTLRLGQEKATPIVRYEQIVTDPVSALVASLPPDLMALLLKQIALREMDMAKAQQNASMRLNIGAKSRPELTEDTPEMADLRAQLAETRDLFGYPGA